MNENDSKAIVEVLRVIAGDLSRIREVVEREGQYTDNCETTKDFLHVIAMSLDGEHGTTIGHSLELIAQVEGEE